LQGEVQAPVCLALLLAAGLSAQQEPAHPVETFSIREEFGVAHPRQIIDFDCQKPIDPKNSFMIGPQGIEVPFQLLRNGKIAVETDLQPNDQQTWRLYAGHRPHPFQNAVRITELPDAYEIMNGLTGVRIARTGHPAWAPIQGILYRNGTWTAIGPNNLEASGKTTGMAVRFLESGPLKVIVEISYSFERPDLIYGGKLLIPRGDGFYRSTIEIQAGQPSILIEDDTDTDLRYSLNIYHGLDPDQARYRGHHSTSIQNGHEPDGRQYRLGHERPAMDAFRDLQYQTAAPSAYTSTAPYIRRMAVWDPWVYDSGWYWQLYNSKAAPDANLLGIFAGPVSEAIGAAHNGAGIFTAPGPAAGIAFETHRGTPDARVFPRVHIAWGIFIGTKRADLTDPYQVQNIARQMNLHGGINLNKVHRYQTSFAEPSGGYRPLYMHRDAVNKIIERVRTDQSYYRQLYDAEPTARPLLNMWRDTTGQKLKAVVDNTTKTARDLLDALVNGDGIYDFRFHYWHGGLEMSRQAVWINSVLTSDLATDEDKARVKAASALFANVLWDPDFVPMFDGHGLNLGTANMPVQQGEYRDLYALLLANHPMMKDRVATACRNALANLHQTVNESGTHMAGTHYIGASMGPLLSTLQQLQSAGIADAFKTEDRLARFAEFYLNLLTPPEIRFGGYRKLISVGDASTESSELFGQLATGFAADNPELSSRLMAAWIQGGSMHSGFHGSTILKIDDTLPSENARLGNATFPGWYTVLRNGWATRNETAAWLVNGDFYRDHAHDDNGAVVMYALGAPLSLDWGSMYSPQTPGGFMHSLVLPESALRFNWSQDNPPLDGGGFRWQHATQQAFESFTASGHVCATYGAPNGTTWTRSLYSIHPDENYPILIVRDGFSGQQAKAEQILTLNLMANGAVDTPQGPVMPPVRLYETGDGPKQFPSVGPVMYLDEGLNRFGFTGQWAIDWDLYTFSPASTQALIGSWSHNWHPNREQVEFRKVNGRPFEEHQYIFRAKFTDALSVLLLPHRKGQLLDATVTTAASTIEIKRPTSDVRIADHCYSYADTRDTILTSFASEPCAASGIAIQGGPAEVALKRNRATITAHGPAGMRTFSLPGTWNISGPIVMKDGKYLLDYRSGAPQAAVLDSR